MPFGSGYGARNYAQDKAIIDTDFRRFWFGILMLLIVAFPFIAGSYYVHLINHVAIVCIGALSLNILTGVSGQISLGHAGLLCAGAFTAALVGEQAGLPFWAVVPIAGMVTGIIGLIMGLACFRLRMLYMILGTLAVHFLIVYIATIIQARAGVIVGFSISNPNLGPIVFDTSQKWYFLLVVIVGIITVVCVNLVRSRTGRAWMAIRDRDIAASALGVNVAFYKLLAFVFSSVLAGIAGSLHAYYGAYASAEEWTFWIGIMYVAMIVIGGLGSILGSFLGAIFVTLLPYVISAILGVLPIPDTFMMLRFAVEFSVFGILIVVFLLVEPGGLTAIWIRIRSFFQLWPFKFKPLVATRK